MNRNRKRGRRKLAPTLFYIIAILCFVCAATSALNTGSVPSNAKTTYIVVQPGDSLWSIAQKEMPNVDPRNWCDWVTEKNHLSGQADLAVGQKILIPVSGR